MGWEKVEQAFRSVGLIGATGVDLGAESKGLFRRPTAAQKLEQATMSFGQGFASTPLQIATAYAVIANGGYRVKPRFARGHGTSSRERVLSAATAKTMRGILEKVVEEEGTGTAAKVDSFRVAGKTGTSQKVDYEARGYKSGAYWSSFAGFLPAQDPRFVIYVLIDEPRTGGYYGGGVAAPVFSRIASAALRFSNPSRAPTPLPPPSTAPLARRPAASSASSESFAKVSLPSNELPDFKGLPLSGALRILQERGAVLELLGNGRFVADQFPAAGARLKAGEKVVLKLR